MPETGTPRGASGQRHPAGANGELQRSSVPRQLRQQVHGKAEHSGPNMRQSPRRNQRLLPRPKSPVSRPDTGITLM